MPAASDPVLSIVYSSTATSPFSDAELQALLTVSRRNNARAGVTGMLLYRDGRFLQVLEGARGPLDAVMERISADTGHRAVRVLLEEPVAARQFPEWTMGFPSVPPAEEGSVPGYRATFDDLADEDGDTSETTPAVRELIRWFAAGAG